MKSIQPIQSKRDAILLFCCMNRLVITLIDTLTLGWAEKQKMWNINCAHADSVDIHKTEGSYISTFHFNTIGE